MKVLLRDPRFAEVSQPAYLSGPMSGHHQFNHPLFNRVARELREEFGWAVINPAEHDGGSTDKPRAFYLQLDVEALCRRNRFGLLPAVGCILLLPQWQESAGVALELHCACEFGIPIFELVFSDLEEAEDGGPAHPNDQKLLGVRKIDPKDLPFCRPISQLIADRRASEPGNGAASESPDSRSVLQIADELVSGERNEDYGHPFDDFTRTGIMAAPVLERWAKETKGDQPIPPEAVALFMQCVKMSREVNRPKRDNRIDGPGYWKCLDMIHQRRGAASAYGALRQRILDLNIQSDELATDADVMRTIQRMRDSIMGVPEEPTEPAGEESARFEEVAR